MISYINTILANIIEWSFSGNVYYMSVTLKEKNAKDVICFYNSITEICCLNKKRQLLSCQVNSMSKAFDPWHQICLGCQKYWQQWSTVIWTSHQQSMVSHGTSANDITSVHVQMKTVASSLVPKPNVCSTLWGRVSFSPNEKGGQNNLFQSIRAPKRFKPKLAHTSSGSHGAAHAISIFHAASSIFWKFQMDQNCETAMLLEYENKACLKNNVCS